MSKHNDIYNILGKLSDLQPKVDTPKEPAQKIYESVEARGSITEGVKSLSEKYEGFKAAGTKIKEGSLDEVKAKKPEALRIDVLQGAKRILYKGLDKIGMYHDGENIEMAGYSDDSSTAWSVVVWNNTYKSAADCEDALRKAMGYAEDDEGNGATDRGEWHGWLRVSDFEFIDEGSLDEPMSEEQMMEKAAPGQEDWVKANKQHFINQYGKEKGLAVLYATSWKRSKQDESIDDRGDFDKFMANYRDTKSEYEPHEKVKVHKGKYGTAYQGDDETDAENIRLADQGKRKRGRPRLKAAKKVDPKAPPKARGRPKKELEPFDPKKVSTPWAPAPVMHQIPKSAIQKHLLDKSTVRESVAEGDDAPESKNSRAFQVKMNDYIVSLFGKIPGFRRRGVDSFGMDSYPTQGVIGGDKWGDPAYIISVSPIGSQVLIDCTIDVTTSNKLHSANSKVLADKVAEYATTIAGQLGRIPGVTATVVPAKSHTMAPSIQVKAPGPTQSSGDTQQTGGRYNPRDAFMSRPGEQARQRRVAQARFSSSFGGDSSNYTRESSLSKRFNRLMETVLVDESNTTFNHILNRFKHEVKEFQGSGGDLDEDLYHALYDYYCDRGEMPYGVAKARSGDPYEWVYYRFARDLDSGSAPASDALDETDGAYGDAGSDWEPPWEKKEKPEMDPDWEREQRQQQEWDQEVDLDNLGDLDEELNELAKLAGLDPKPVDGPGMNEGEYGDTKIAKAPEYANTPEPEVEKVEVITKGGTGEVAGKEKKMNKHGSARFSDNPLAAESIDPLASLGRKLMQAYESIKVKK